METSSDPDQLPLKGGIRLLVVDEAIAPGGVEQMCMRLMPELARRCELLIWLLPAHRTGDYSRRIPSDSGIRIEPLHPDRRSALLFLSSAVRRVVGLAAGRRSPLHERLQAWEQHVHLRRLVRRHSITHVLYPALFAQAFPRLPVPVFAGVMDVNYDTRWRDFCLRNLSDWGARAEGMVAISRFTRSEVLKIAGVSGRKLRAVPIACGIECIVGGRKPGSQADGRLRLYHPSSFNPHKGHAVLLRALRMLFDQGLNFELTLTGLGTEQLLANEINSRPELEEARLAMAAAPAEFRSAIKVLGYVTPDEVRRCFSSADIVVLPSTYEGFGLPLVEGVASGCHVVCSDIPAFREQMELYGIERAVTIVGKPDENTWARAILGASKLLRNAPSGVEQSAGMLGRWTWQNVADEYLRMFEDRTSLISQSDS